MEESGQRDAERHICKCTSSGNDLVIKLGVFKLLLLFTLTYNIYIFLCMF